MRLFTSTTCGPCTGLKQWLASKNIEDIEEYDIRDHSGLLRSLGIRKVPTLEHKGVIYVGNEEIRPFLEKYHGIK